MTTHQYNVAKKYPFIFDGDKISLWKVGDHINVIQNCDSTYLNAIGLQDFMKDIKYIFSNIKRERKRKLEKLNKLNEL